MWLFLFIYFFGMVSSYSYKPLQNHNVQRGKTPLTNEQWVHIKNILKNKSTPSLMKKKIQHILYTKYENMAFWKAYQFKKFHSHKCRNISLAELSLYSKIGLHKAIEKYNPQYHFYPYMNLYIDSELFKGLTDLYPICSISKRERVKKKKFSIIHFVPSQMDDTYDGGDNKELQLQRFENAITTEKKALFIKKLMHNKLLNTKFIGKDDWLIDKNIEHNENEIMQSIINKETYEEMWYKINHSLDVTPFQKRIFHLKYDSQFNKIRSNRKVAELMDCSEEYVRRQLLVDGFTRK